MSRLMIKKRASKAPEMHKTSGRSVPMNPGQWQLEVLKDVRSKHPYIDLQGASVEFVENKPEEMRAWGSIKVGSKAIIPFFIMPPKKASSPELADIDMIVSEEGGFRALNEGSYAEATISEQSGTQIDPNKANYGGAPPSNNNYIGEATGDVSPMENYNPGINQASGFGKVGSANLNEINLAKLNSILGSKPNLLSIARSYGYTNTSLGSVKRPDVMFLRMANISDNKYDSKVSIEVCTNDGASVQYIRPSALQDLLSRDQAKDVFARLASKGWAVVGGPPTRTSICIDELDIPYFPVDQPGEFELYTKSSDNSVTQRKSPGFGYRDDDAVKTPVLSTVFTQVTNLAGQTHPSCVAITADGLYQSGQAFVGYARKTYTRAPGGYAPEGYEGILNLADMSTGDMGCFVDLDSKVVTRPYKIAGHIQTGDGGLIIKLRPLSENDSKGGPVSYIVFNDWITSPQRMLPVECEEYGIDEGYWIPSSMAWSKLTSLKPTLLEYSSSGGFMNKSAQASINKLSHGRYSVEGEDSSGKRLNVDIDSLAKLAFWTLGVGGTIEDVDRFFEMQDGRSVDLTHLNRGASLGVQKRAQTRSVRVAPHHQNMLKEAQEELAQGMESQAETPNSAMPQKDTMTDLLSLLSIGDDSVVEFIQNKEQIRVVEDGIGKLLFSIRKGDSQGSEAAMSRAFRAIGGIYTTIETIENDLRARGEIQ